MQPDRTEHEPDALEEALSNLEQALRALPVALPVPDREERRSTRDRVASDVAGQRARWRDREAPLLVVIGGGTGAGKSTVLNTLVGKPLAATGVIRPTTSSPTLVATPGELSWFTSERVLSDLPRVERRGRGPVGERDARVLHLVPSHALPHGLALVDAPDIDSIRTEHRDLADALLDAADVWLWLATARTYADEQGMAYLRRAARRRTALAVVLTQVHERDVGELTQDLEHKLAGEGLDGVQRLVVPYAPTDGERLPGWAIDELRSWLWTLARPSARAQLRHQTLDGALEALHHEVAPVLEAGRDDRAAVERLAASADRAFGEAGQRVGAALTEGLPLRQEVLARWADLVGGQRFREFVESATGMVKGWLREALHRRTDAEEQRVEREVRAEIGGAVAERITETLDLLAAEVAESWEAEPAGAGVVAGHPDLRGAAPMVRDRAGDAVVEWQDTIAELVRTKGAERRVRARWLSTLVNAAATGAIVLAFASTGGLTGVEVGIAASASAANQWLLTKLLGEQNVRWLLQRVRDDLLERVEALAREERARFDAALDGLAPEPEALERLVAALRAVEAAREQVT